MTINLRQNEICKTKEASDVLCEKTLKMLAIVLTGVCSKNICKSCSMTPGPDDSTKCLITDRGTLSIEESVTILRKAIDGNKSKTGEE